MKTRTLVSIVLFLAVQAGSSRAAFIAPTAVIASNGEDTAITMIDGESD
ncbi:MAG: hypothetical protein ACI8T1_003966 [Verrucomicrobiales bacterium]|jgi:hypothetical protein